MLCVSPVRCRAARRTKIIWFEAPAESHSPIRRMCFAEHGIYRNQCTVHSSSSSSSSVFCFETEMCQRQIWKMIHIRWWDEMSWDEMRWDRLYTSFGLFYWPNTLFNWTTTIETRWWWWRSQKFLIVPTVPCTIYTWGPLFNLIPWRQQYQQQQQQRLLDFRALELLLSGHFDMDTRIDFVVFFSSVWRCWKKRQ